MRRVDQADHDAAIAILLDRTDRILKILDGNGKAGMVEEFGILKQNVKDVRDDLDARAPTRREKNTMIASAAGGAVALLGWLVTEVIPRLKQ